jgi:hypothetical protein
MMAIAILRGKWSSLVAGTLLLVGGCMSLSPEERLRSDLSDEIYVTSARECAQHYGTIRVTRVAVNGDLQGDTAADSKSEIRQFTACYWEGIQTRVKKREEKGQPVPEPFNLKPEVDLD